MPPTKMKAFLAFWALLDFCPRKEAALYCRLFSYYFIWSVVFIFSFFAAPFFGRRDEISRCSVIVEIALSSCSDKQERLLFPAWNCAILNTS